MGDGMKDRREFLKSAATGAVLLGSQTRLGLAGMLAQSGENSKPRVVVARDEALHGAGSQLDENRVLALLDRAVTSYFGRQKPMEAWKGKLTDQQIDDVVVSLSGRPVTTTSTPGPKESGT